MQEASLVGRISYFRPHKKRQNMTKNLIIAALAIFPVLAAAQDRLTAEEDDALRQAVEASDNGREDEAVESLLLLRKAHPNDYAINYELGYALMMKKDYEGAAKTFRALQNRKESDDLTYAMEGNALDYMGKRGDALRTYRKGLDRFPNSGRLMMELGNIKLSDEQYEAALEWYVRGMEAEPSFPSNYFRAAALLLNSSDTDGGLAAGEAFMMLNPSGDRSRTMSKMLSDAYRTLLATDTAAGKEQTELRRVAEKKSRLLDMGRSESACGATGQRVRAVEEAIRAAGHWTAYCAWLTRMGDEARFRGWMGFHENDLERFAEWFGSEGERLIDREFDR